MKPISRRLAAGTVGNAIIILYFVLYLITGSSVFLTLPVYVFLFIFTICVSSFIGSILSKGYSDEENDDKIFYAIGAVLLIILFVLIYYYIEIYTKE